MAAKKKAKAAPKPKKQKASRRETRDSPGAGHNLKSLSDNGVEFVKRFFNLNEQMASDMAGYMSDIDTIYEEAANDLGIKKAVITRELKRMLKNKKAADKEKEMKADEREQTTLWREAMVGTQFALFAEGDLAEPEAGVGGEDREDADFAEVE